MVPLDNGFLILGVGIILPTVVPNSEIHISRFVPARSSDKLSRAHSITETIITIWHTNNMYLLISLKLAILTRVVFGASPRRFFFNQTVWVPATVGSFRLFAYPHTP